MIKRCNCKHEYQDKVHGKNMRVFNPAKVAQGKPLLYRCTVCGNEQR